LIKELLFMTVECLKWFFSVVCDMKKD
jgi:hypothetical protein